MSASPPPVNVRILDREYTIGVSEDEREGLIAAAKFLDGRMREIRGANRMAAIDRIAVLAALNLAHEMQQQRDELGGRERALDAALRSLQEKLDGLLASNAGAQ